MNISDYYQSYHNYFWIWDDDGDVLTISGGSTIAFRKQIAEILTGMAHNGLPPFGSFLLVMIGTNKTMDDSVTRVENILKVHPEVFQKEGMVDSEPFKNTFEFLRLLGDIPTEFKTGKRRKILLETIFASSHNRANRATSKGIANGLLQSTKVRGRYLQAKEMPGRVFWKDLTVVSLLLRKFPSAQSIVDAMGELPDLEEEDISALESVSVTETTYKDFVDELMHNPKAFELAALIKPIWAGFNVPIFSAHPSEQPLGGFSDLSNKGDFDKLLISEFANDELIFMNRLANNEALYLHREMPPVRDNLHRTILIDVSLKSWGTPKLLSFATYIAIARHPRAITESRAYVLGEKLLPVSCSSTTEIIDALQQTDAALHPGAALAEFLEANKKDKDLEVFFISTAEALKYPQVQKQLADYHACFKYIITTQADGVINFYKNKRSSLQHLQTISLPLEKLWAQKMQVKVRQLPPVIMQFDSVIFPILLPLQTEIRKALPLGSNESYFVANRCLLKQDKSKSTSGKGMELMLRNVPAHSMYEIGRLDNGQVVFLYFNPQNLELCITNLDTQQRAVTKFEQWNLKMFREFLFHPSQVFIYLVQNPKVLRLIPDFDRGTIAVTEDNLNSGVFAMDYQQRQDEIRKQPAVFGNTSILKNITQVYISDDNYLVFNEHQFRVNNGGAAFLTKAASHAKQVAVRSSNKREFVFKDGSAVEVDSLGFITLVSSNPALKKVYITSTPGALPGMATVNEFAGNEFYFHEGLGKVNVRILSVSGQILQCIKIVRDSVKNMGLADIKILMDKPPGLLPPKIELNVAENMVRQLAENGCSAVIEKKAHPTQAIISAEKFYLENIATFIGHIINYEPAG